MTTPPPDLQKRARNRFWAAIAIYLALFIHVPIIIYNWWRGSGAGALHSGHGAIIASGRLCGLLGAFAIIIDFILISRLPVFERVLGRPVQNKLHKWAGYAAFIFISLHFCVLIWGYSAITHLSLYGQWWSFITTFEDVLKSFLAFLLLILVVGLSVYIVRRKLKYETWYYVHLLSYAIILLAFQHQLKVGTDFIGHPLFVDYWWALYLFLFVIVVGYRFVRPILISIGHDLRVDRIVAETPDIHSIYISGRDLRRLKYRGGQFAIWRFLDWDRFWQGHPFSISITPGGDELRVTVKESGDFTATIGKLKPGTRLIMDGPYGIFSAAAITKPKLLFIAGGIGVTPLISMLRESAELSPDIVFLYSARTPASLAFKSELDSYAKQFGAKVTYIISEDPSYQGETGILEQQKLARLVPDASERQVFLCGPPPMMKAVAASLQNLGVVRTDIQTEDFSF